MDIQAKIQEAGESPFFVSGSPDPSAAPSVYAHSPRKSAHLADKIFAEIQESL